MLKVCACILSVKTNKAVIRITIDLSKYEKYLAKKIFNCNLGAVAEDH